MRLNDIITDKIKKDFTAETGLKGKIARKMLRQIAKDSISSQGKNSGDSYSKVKMSRQERKSLAKKLKVPFEPRYNAPIFKMQYETVKNEKGYEKLQTLLVEIEQ